MNYIDQGFLFRIPQQTQHGTVTVEYMNREIAKEREEIAKCFENHWKGEYTDEEIASAIRARGQA
jgi:hypothetical protein